MKTWTTVSFRAAKGVQKLACVTAYDYTFASLADEAEIPMVLIGDSLGMTMLGHSGTLPVTMEQMLSATAAVARGVRKHSLVVADMPFLSYQTSLSDGIRNAGRFLQEANAEAVKLEGFYPELVRECVKAGIPVCAHLGMTPQSVNVFGGFKVQAKEHSAAELLIEQSKAIAEAGAFALVLECVPPDVAGKVTAAVPIPTIGIGAGNACDGQILVMHDLLGLTEKPPKLAKRFADLRRETIRAFREYADEVRGGAFPAQENIYKPSTTLK